MAKFERLPNGHLVFEGLKGEDIIFKNFTGRESEFNMAGSRNFNLIIRDAELAQALNEEGFNIKIREPRDESEDTMYHLKISVRYRKRDGGLVKFPPKVTIDNGRSAVKLDEDGVGDLDDLRINECDVEFRAWENPRNPEMLCCDLCELWASVSPMGLAAKHERYKDEDDMSF